MSTNPSAPARKHSRKNPEARLLSARIAAAYSRPHVFDAQKVDGLKRDLRAVELADYVEKVVSQAPPLTDEQIDRVVAILRPSGGDRRKQSARRACAECGLESTPAGLSSHQKATGHSGFAGRDR